MRRREFIAQSAAIGMTWPFAAMAQPSPVSTIGFLSVRSLADSTVVLDAFRRGLSEMAYVEGKNVTIEYRWAEGQVDRLPTLAAELVQHNVAVIVAPGSATAAKEATSRIPVVAIESDPIRLGMVRSLNRPGGNFTGVAVLLFEMESKRLGLLQEVVPNASLIAVLVDPRFAMLSGQVRDIEETAQKLNRAIRIFQASSPQEIDGAFRNIGNLKPGAMLVAASPFFNNRREQIVTLVNQYKIPAIYEVREFAKVGGLMSYGTSLAEAYRVIGNYAGRILRGEKPGDLPIFQLNKFQFVINMKTARELGIDIPGTLSARADEVIE